MGFLSSLGSAICSCISGVGRAISAIGSAVFRGIGAIANGIANFLTPKNRIEEKDYERFSYTTDIRNIKPENYDKVSEYINAGKEAMKTLTPEEETGLENLSEDKKKEYVSNTYSTLFQAFAEEIGLKTPITIGTIKGAAELKMDAKEFKQMVEDYKEGKIPTMDISATLDNKLNAVDDMKMYEYLKDKLDRINEKLEENKNQEM